MPTANDLPLRPEERLLTEQELARRWAISVKTLQAARLKGTGVAWVKIGRLVRYRATEVQAYEAAHLRSSTAEEGVRG